MGRAHIPLYLLLRDQRSHGVYYYDVYGLGINQRLRYLERLLAAVRLRDYQLVYIDAQLLGVHRVERVLRVDERRLAALLLDLRNDVQGDRGLA